MHGRVRVAEVPWYRDRIVKNISLGSLIMLLLLRLIQQNLTQVRGDWIAIEISIFFRLLVLVTHPSYSCP